MTNQQLLTTAPDLSISQWFNAPEDLTLGKLLGKVVVIEAFQMLCPGCISHGLPQAQTISSLFPKDKVAVLGLHTVFEHHDAMTPVSLKAFIHEYRLNFPIGVDEAGLGPMPKTMEAYHMRGTPSLIIIDQKGFLRSHHFGQTHDMQIGAEIATLLHEETLIHSLSEAHSITSGCDNNGCPV